MTLSIDIVWSDAAGKVYPGNVHMTLIDLQIFDTEKPTVTWSCGAHLVLSVRAQTGQATAGALGVGAEPIPRLETHPT